MIADRLLDRLRLRLGYVPTGWSLLRIGIATALLLGLFSWVVPYHSGDDTPVQYAGARGSDHSRIVSLPLGDTRGFRPTAGKGFRIAWIGGSETLGVKPGQMSLIPGLVNDRIRRVDGRRARTDIYFLNAIRLTDQLAALHRALASKPDLVVISLNPTWVLNDLAVQQWGYLDGILARGSAWPPSSWPVAASLVSPGEVGWKALSAGYGAVADRLYWGTKLTEKTSHLSFLHAIDGATPPPLTGLALLSTARPVDFWHEHYDGVPKNGDLMAKQLPILRREVASRSSFNRQVLRDMFTEARRAGVDTYFYMPAIAPQVYRSPEGRRYMDQLRKDLAEATRGETSSRVRFDPRGLQDRVPPTPYKDIVHKYDPGPEVRVLTGDLCAFLRARGHETRCAR